MNIACWHRSFGTRITYYATAAAWHGHPSASHIGAIIAYVADTRAEARRMMNTQPACWL
jgi:hypothetical protein